MEAPIVSSSSMVFRPLLPLWLLRGLVAYFLTAKLAYAAIVPPNSDEAYYWIWGQHLQISYLDHAPLVGWGSFVSAALLGWTPLALHLMPLCSTAIIGLALWIWSQRLAPDQPQELFWAGFAVFLASPLMLFISTLLYPDQILMAIGLLAITVLAVFLDHWENGERRWRLLFLGAALVGLSMLAKYNGAFIAVGFFLAAVARPKLRTLFRTPRFYLAGVVAALFLLPVIIWAAQNNFDNFRLHAVDRFENHGTGFALAGAVSFLEQSALDLSPLLLWPLIRFVLARRLDGFGGTLHAIALWMFLASTIATTAFATWQPSHGQVAPHWNIMGVLPFAALAVLFIGNRWLLAAELAFGAVVAGLAVVYFIACPLVTDALGIPDAEAVRYFGHEQVIAAAQAAASERGADFVATLGYSSAAQLSFGAGKVGNIVSISPNLDQYDLWVDQRALAGKTALVVTEWDGQEKEGRPLFDSLEKIGDVTPTRFGHKLWSYGLYLGRGYHPAPPP